MFSESPVPSLSSAQVNKYLFKTHLQRPPQPLVAPIQSLGLRSVVLEKLICFLVTVIKGKVSFRKALPSKTEQEHTTLTLSLGVLKEEWPGTVVGTYRV